MSMGSELSAAICDDCEKATATRRRGVLRLCDCCYRGGPLAVAPRIVVATPVQVPQDAPKAVEAAPDMPAAPEAPVARLRLATVSVGQYRERWAGGAPVPRVKLPMVVGKLVRGNCRIDGCTRNARTRGLCEGCAKQATGEGVFERVAAASVRVDSKQLVDAVIAEVRRKPGRTIRQIGPLNGRGFEATREAAYSAVKKGLLVRKDVLYFLPDAP